MTSQFLPKRKLRRTNLVPMQNAPLQTGPKPLKRAYLGHPPSVHMLAYIGEQRVVSHCKKMKVSELSSRHLYLVAAAAALFITCVTAVPEPAKAEQYFVENRSDEKVFHGRVGNTLEECQTEDYTYTRGTCMLSEECTNVGGIHSGTCASGLGTCCIVIKTCASTTIYNNTYFVTPEESSADAGACKLTINRVDSGICQVRLNFNAFHLSQPDINGHCVDDFLTVTGGPPDIPAICGKNEGTHMYVDVDPFGGALELTVDLIKTVTISRNWIINVAQIACNSRYKAPDGCLQYYTETSGTVKSFNFDNSVPLTLDPRQISNHNYGVCIKQAFGYCGIVWERDTRVGSYSLTISENVEAIPPSLIGDPVSSETGASCTTDYVVIPGGVTDLMQQADRFCGLGFPLSVTSTTTPFVLYVKTDGNEAPDGENMGFQLNYRQTTFC